MSRWMLGLSVAAAAAFAPAAAAGEACGFGTKVRFVDTPKEAAAKARQDQKLVFVLHVSGHFEDPGLT